MNKNLVVILFLIVSIFTFADYQNENVVVEGVGAIEKNNYAKARDEALWDAQRKAVEKGIGVFLNSETIVKNSKLIQDNIYTQSNGFVSNYKILTEKKDEFLYYIKIEAEVKTAEIGNQLIFLGLIKKIGDPRIMVIIEEQGVDGDNNGKITEGIITKELLNAGYRMVDSEQIDNIRKSEEIRKIVEGKDETAKEVASHYKADIIITGHSYSRKGGEIEEYGIKISSVDTKLNIKAIKVDNGEIIINETISITKSNPASEIKAQNQALEEIGKIIAKGGTLNGKKINPLSESIAKSILKKPSIQILFYGIKSEEYLKIIDILKNERTIKNVFAREMSTNVSRIDVDYEKNSEDLKKIIESIEGIDFITKNITKNKIEFETYKKSLKKIEVENISFKDFKEIIDEIEKLEQVKIKEKKFDSNMGEIEIKEGELYLIAEKLALKYDIVSLETKILKIRKK